MPGRTSSSAAGAAALGSCAYSTPAWCQGWRPGRQAAPVVKAAAQNGDGAAAKSAWAANHAHGQRSVLTVTPRAGSGVA